MADTVDRAQDREAELTADALAQHRLRWSADGAGATECVLCGEPIPAARRRAVPHAVRCIDCERMREQQARRA